MEFREGVAVYAPDGRHLGNVDHLVIDPSSRRVTHIVIRQGHLLSKDKLIGVEQLSTATGDRPVLDSEPKGLAPFEESHFVPLDEGTRRQWGIDHGVPLLWGGGMAGDRVPYPDLVAERVERQRGRGAGRGRLGGRLER
jgi:sporulation protein YlmC with PRC-barrel domain